jgi:hypothetical protein
VGFFSWGKQEPLDSSGLALVLDEARKWADVFASSDQLKADVHRTADRLWKQAQEFRGSQRQFDGLTRDIEKQFDSMRLMNAVDKARSSKGV